MSRHLDEIKDLLFDEPEFDDEEVMKTASIQSKATNEKRVVETIVFCDPAKKKKKTKKKSNEAVESVAEKPSNSDFDLEKARFDVHKFGMKGFEKSKYEDARVALAVSLGAKPPKRKFINYRELLEQNRAKKEKEKEEEENARLLGDVFRKTLGNKKKFDKKSKQKRIGQGDVGAMRFSSVGKFQGGVLKLTNKDISKIKSKSRPRKP